MKSARHAKIHELIQEYSIETQSELAKLLRQHGFDVTQTTVSRDIKELKLVKTLADNPLVYKYSASELLQPNNGQCCKEIFAGTISSVKCAGNLVIIKTIRGAAMAVAETLSAANLPKVAGIVSDFETIFVAAADGCSVASVKTELEELLPGSRQG